MPTIARSVLCCAEKANADLASAFSTSSALSIASSSEVGWRLPWLGASSFAIFLSSGWTPSPLRALLHAAIEACSALALESSSDCHSGREDTYAQRT